MARGSAPFQVVNGQVVGSYQGTNHYDIISDYGRYIGIYHGVTRGPGGVMESGGLQPGTCVVIACAEGDKFAHILGLTLPLWGVDAEKDPRQVATLPQVTGFRPNGGLSGELYRAGVAGLQNRPTDVLNDLVNGEWAVASPHGPGTGVELFRAWLRGGPMTGIWCWSDLTRVAGLDYEFLTLAQQDYDRRHGNSIVQSRSRVWYPDEALSDKLPRELELNGPIHGGSHKFIGAQAAPGTPRLALLHEYRGTDGAYAVTSARSVILQRACTMILPEESRPDPATDEAPLGDQPLDDDQVRQDTLAAPFPGVLADDSAKDGLGWVQHFLDVLDNQVQIRGRGGVTRLPVQWPDLGAPDGVPEDAFHTTYDAQMWRGLPESFEIQLDSIEKGRRFYVGRSVVALMPDGSIVIEDANHDQVIMAGGNIMLSAPHDLILAAGRNIVQLAGRDCSIRADRNIDVSSNNGRVSVKAEDLLSLLGGNGGTNGVLIESRGIDAYEEGTGTDQVVGGVLIKSTSRVHVAGADVSVDATQGDVTLRAESQLTIVAPQVTAEAENGVYFFHDDTGEKGYAFTPDNAVMASTLIVQGQLLALGDGFFDGNVILADSVAAGGSVSGSSVGPRGADDRSVDTAVRGIRSQITTSLAGLTKSLAQVATSIETLLAAKLPLNREILEHLGFSFATSEQLRTNQEGAFVLPETTWQTVSRRGDNGQGRTWTENPVLSPSGDNRPTSAAPGYEAWSVSLSYRLNDRDLYANLETGQIIPHEDGNEVLPEPTAVPLDGNFLIGDDT